MQGLTPLEFRAVSEFVGGAPSMVRAVALAGGSDPTAQAARIFARPRVKSALNAALVAAGATPERVAARYAAELDNPETYKARLHAADSISRIMGEMGDRDRDSDGARGSVTNFTVVVVQPAADAIRTVDAD